MTEIRPGMVWLTIDEAALRVGRSTRTLRNWSSQGLITIRLGRIDEHQLMLATRKVAAAKRQRTSAALQVRHETRNLAVNVDSPRPERT